MKRRFIRITETELDYETRTGTPGLTQAAESILFQDGRDRITFNASGINGVKHISGRSLRSRGERTFWILNTERTRISATAKVKGEGRPGTRDGGQLPAPPQTPGEGVERGNSV